MQLQDGIYPALTIEFMFVFCLFFRILYKIKKFAQFKFGSYPLQSSLTLLAVIHISQSSWLAWNATWKPRYLSLTSTI